MNTPQLVSFSHRDKLSHKYNKYRCDCGRIFTSRESSVRYHRTLSCGCYQKRRATELGLKHGHSKSILHKPSKTYSTWSGMKNRCFDPKNRDYGGRGIKVCSHWTDSFAAFLSDMGAKPAGLSIDRINNDGNYEPGNCRWATREEQRNNQRRCKQKKGKTK